MNEDDILKDMIKYSDDNAVEEEEIKEETIEEASPETPAHETSSLDDSDEGGSEECFSADSDEKQTEAEEIIEEKSEEFATKTPISAEAKKKRMYIFAFSLLTVVALIVAFSVIDTGIIGTYKKNLTTNVVNIFANMGIDISKKPKTSPLPISDTSNISEDAVGDGKKEQTKVKATPSSSDTVEYKTDVKFSQIFPFDSASESEFAPYKKGLVCAKTNALCYINSSGEIEWEIMTSVIDPMLRVEDDYILLVQENGKKMCLYNGKELLYDVDAKNNILTCGLNGTGDAVIVTEKQYYKGALSVYNKAGEEIYAWSSGSDLILSADISTDSRRVAALLLNTDETVKSSILLFNVNKADNYARCEFEDTALFEVVFADENINAFGDNSMVGVNTSGKILYDKRFDDVELVNYTVDNEGSKVMVFNSENIPMMNIYNSAGSLKYTVTTLQQPDFVEISSYNLMYNSNRDILLGKPNGRKLSKYTASMDIKQLVLIDSRTFAIIYSNSVEFVKI